MTDGKLFTLGDVFRQGLEQLSLYQQDNASNEAVYLLELVFGTGRRELLQQPKAPVDPQKAQRYFSLIQRRTSGEPLQYILGKWEFMGLPFAVGPGVLIPRQETEELALLAIAHLKQYDSPLGLDLCSGTGCIPISIGKLCPSSQIWGVELSGDAFKYFRQNIALNKTENVTPFRGDVFALPGEAAGRKYHLVTSNPPYIATDELRELQTEVCKEPVMALDGGSDGLDFYRRLPGIAHRLLLPGGLLVMEIGEKQGQSVLALTRQAGFTDVTLKKDIFGNDRIVYGYVDS